MQTLPTNLKKTKKVSPKKNGSKPLSFENLSFPSYEVIKSEINKKAGKRPSLPAGLSKGTWSDQSIKVLSERYLKKNSKGDVTETPEQMCWRVSWDIASAEVRWGAKRRDVIKKASQFYEMLVSHKFLPNSPTLMNAGTENGLQYSACFVLPVGDSLVEIFDAVKYQALIHQTGGGTGFSFSRLRPKGSRVKSSNGVASGPISFMKIFDAATNEVKQGGRRRGANMGILRVDHPDVIDFIHCKDKGGITNFNISVAITDKFMKAYENNEDYNLIDPRSKTKVGTLSAQKVFDEIAESAWKTGDPGLVFIDKMNRGTTNPVPPLGPVESTNPCGEQPLYPYDSCNLGSIFLNYFVNEKKGKKVVDWDGLKETSALAIAFMDDVIEMNPYPIGEIRNMTQAIRRIGLGVGGWADMLISLEIPYNSDEALVLARKVMSTIQKAANTASEELAKNRGPFPMWPVSVYKNKKPRRNSTVTTIAPTGSISIIAGSSSGIEPIFAIAFQHIVKDESLDRTLSFINPHFEEVARARGFWSEKIKQLVVEKGNVHGIEEVPEDVRNFFVTSHEIHHDWHIKMQAAFQDHVENAVSKTINMANSVSVDDIRQAYLQAWNSSCQGITVFRDGCRDVQVLNMGVKENSEKETVVEKWVRPLKVTGATYKIATPVGTAFITVNHDEKDNPIEVFINVGKAGSDVQAMAEALGRIISKSLKFDSHLTATERALTIIDQLKGIGGRTSVGFGPNRIRSLPEAIAVALSNHFNVEINGNGKHEHKNGELKVADETADTPLSAAFLHKPAPRGDICPSCGSGTLVYQEGCSKCHACGHSEC